MTDSTLQQVENLVSKSLARTGFTGQGPNRLVVGVSGGPDSVALLYCLYRLREKHNLILHVAHLNHDFRGEEADADADFVAKVAAELELPCTIDKQDPVAYQRERGISSFEQGARELRYAFLGRVATEVDAPAVAVAHTADDQAETVLMHIIRGTGLHGLQGMAELASWPWPPDLPQVRLFRPLLDVTKAQTSEFCNLLGRSFRIDTGNALPRFTRNRVRQNLLPHLADEYNPRVKESLIRLAHTSSLELDYLERELDHVWPKLLFEEINRTQNSLTLGRAVFLSLHPALQTMALRRAYVQIRGDARRLTEHHLHAMDEMASRPASGQVMQLPGGAWFHVAADFLCLNDGPALPGPFPPILGSQPVSLPTRKNEPEITRLTHWEISIEMIAPPSLEGLKAAGPLEAFLDASAMQGHLAVRPREAGDRFHPLGMARDKKLQDFFVDAQVPADWRDSVPLLTVEDKIAWVVGYRIAQWARIRLQADQQSPIYRVSFTPSISAE